MGKNKGVSFNPETYREGGGLLDDANVTWAGCEFVSWDYNGNVAVPVPAFKLTLEVEGAEEGSEPVEQYYSCGSAKDWEPSEDGKELVPVGQATGLNKNSNFAMLVNSLIEAGFPADKIDSDCSVFEGLMCHMVRVPEPKRAGLVREPRADGKNYEKTVLVVDKVEKLPWEGKKGGKTTGTAGKGKAAAKDEGGEDDESLKSDVTEAIMEIAGENPKGIDKKKLAAALFQKFKTDARRNDIVKLAYNDEFLDEGPWEFDAKKGIVK